MSGYLAGFDFDGVLRCSRTKEGIPRWIDAFAKHAASGDEVVILTSRKDTAEVSTFCRRRGLEPRDIVPCSRADRESKARWLAEHRRPAQTAVLYDDEAWFLEPCAAHHVIAFDARED